MEYTGVKNYEMSIASRISRIFIAKRLHDKYPNSVSYYLKENPFYMSISRLEGGRSGPKLTTWLKILKTNEVITDYEQKTEYPNCGFYHVGKPNKKWYISVNKDWFYEYIKDKGVAPEFVSSKEEVLKKEEKSIKDISMYRDIFSCCNDPDNAIYLYKNINKDIYDIKEIKRKINNKYYRREYSYSLLIYPKEKLRDLSSSVFYKKVTKYIEDNFSYWYCKLILGQEDPIMSELHEIEYIKFNLGHDNFHKKGIERRFQAAQDTYNMLKDFLPKLEKLIKSTNEIYQTKEDKWEDERMFNDVRDKFLEYIETYFPIHFNDNDLELKKIAELVMDGKHKGELVPC